MWGKISDDIVFYCGCGYMVNPYTEGLISISPEAAFNYYQQNIQCPCCHKFGHWQYKG